MKLDSSDLPLVTCLNITNSAYATPVLNVQYKVITLKLYHDTWREYWGAGNARQENAELENAAQTAGLENARRLGFEKPIKPKQPTHFRMLI